MQKVNDGVPTVWWCPRCGTLKFDKGVPDHEAPRFLKCVLTNLQHVNDTPMVPRDEPGPVCGVLWGKVSYLFGLGSTWSIHLCRVLGFDPHQQS